MIKKIIIFVCLLFIGSTVYAEKFTIGDYISGEHVRMVSANETKNLTIQMIVDSDNNFVYCIEPFVLVDQKDKDYFQYVSNLSRYKRLSEEQKRRISLLAYYGYGFQDRTSKKWYAVTQLLIWQTVEPNNEFYFTDKLNGEKIDKYTNGINLLLQDVNNHDKKPSFIKDYEVNYKDDLIIENFDSEYVFDSDYVFEYIASQNIVKVNEVIKDGKFIFQRKNGNYLSEVTIYENKDSQDLIRPGNIINEKYEINVKVNSGNILLDIKKDVNDIYTVESDFSNTCYEISDDKNVIDKVCTGTEELVYKTNALPFGEYTIKQVSVGKGYEFDFNTYKIVVDGSQNNLILNNNLIKNKIELVKYYCVNDECLYEADAEFKVFDSNNTLVGIITTNEKGYGFLDVGYGRYTIIQTDAIYDYTFCESYVEDIVNSVDSHYKELRNYEIVDNVEHLENIDSAPSEVVNDEEEKHSSEEINPPKTGTNIADYIKILYNIFIVIICCCNIMIICYNN